MGSTGATRNAHTHIAVVDILSSTPDGRYRQRPVMEEMSDHVKLIHTRRENALHM